MSSSPCDIPCRLVYFKLILLTTVVPVTWLLTDLQASCGDRTISPCNRNVEGLLSAQGEESLVWSTSCLTSPSGSLSVDDVVECSVHFSTAPDVLFDITAIQHTLERFVWLLELISNIIPSSIGTPNKKRLMEELQLAMGT